MEDLAPLDFLAVDCFQGFRKNSEDSLTKEKEMCNGAISTNGGSTSPMGQILDYSNFAADLQVYDEDLLGAQELPCIKELCGASQLNQIFDIEESEEGPEIPEFSRAFQTEDFNEEVGISNLKLQDSNLTMFIANRTV